jgi:hypothetical protein
VNSQDLVLSQRRYDGKWLNFGQWTIGIFNTSPRGLHIGAISVTRFLISTAFADILQKPDSTLR